MSFLSTIAPPIHSPPSPSTEVSVKLSSRIPQEGGCEGKIHMKGEARAVCGGSWDDVNGQGFVKISGTAKSQDGKG